MREYRQCLEDVLMLGRERDDRTGTGTISLFAPAAIRIDNSGDTLPIVTGKKILFDKIKDELQWFISGSTNVNDIRKRSQNIWRPWANDDGSLGPIYGQQFRDVGGQDPLRDVIKAIKANPFSRRHVLTLWNTAQIDQMNLPPCHGTVIQFCVTPELGSEESRLDMFMYQRSGDMFLGVPFNITSYALFQKLVANSVGIPAGRFTYQIGDAHIYLNHIEQVKEYLERETFPFPTVTLPDVGINITTLSDYDWDSIVLNDYQHGEFISAPVSV